MSAGRRGLMLSITFLGLAVWLCPNRHAHAQPGRGRPVQPGFGQNAPPETGRHDIWQSHLTADQVRALLMRFGKDDGKSDWFEELIRKAVADKNKNADPKQVDEAIKKLMANKEFMDRVKDLAQKHKNEMPNNGNGGPPPKFTREDLAKLAQIKPDGPGDPFKLPDENKQPVDPNTLPKFDPKQFPNFNPDKFERDPNTGFPLDPNTGRPFNPNTGRPLEPKNNPPADPPNPPVPPDAPPDKPRFDDNNPLGPPDQSPEQIAKQKAAQAATALWEKNVGPIDESPAVKRAILDLVSDQEAMNALTDGKGNNIFDFLQNEGGDGEKLGDLLGGDGKDTSGWEWPKFDFGWSRGRNTDFDIAPSRPRDRDWTSRSSSRSRGGSSALDGMGTFNFGTVRVPWLLVLIVLALIVATVVWWKWGAIVQSRTSVAAAGGGADVWPIDPRAIATREDVVKAFEFLSVLLCGPDAKTWTHSTIADELTALAATHGETAIKLARLYELARYAPLDEPLTRAELLEARRLACDLAGVDEV